MRKVGSRISGQVYGIEGLGARENAHALTARKELLRVGRCAQISAKQAKAYNQPFKAEESERNSRVPSPSFSTSLILSLPPPSS